MSFIVGGRRYHPGMPGDQAAALIPADSASTGLLPAGSAQPGAELVARVRAELPTMAALGQQEELLAAA
jgi:hypothetical protein